MLATSILSGGVRGGGGDGAALRAVQEVQMLLVPRVDEDLLGLRQLRGGGQRVGQRRQVMVVVKGVSRCSGVLQARALVVVEV